MDGAQGPDELSGLKNPLSLVDSDDDDGNVATGDLHARLMEAPLIADLIGIVRSSDLTSGVLGSVPTVSTFSPST
ncbi:hypothetical protein N7492_004173 [Penicillium capsulatum]|uniref:Uncharacterized protein n=1 Tax=Penicillium capsulatum TaxID=69766 RepID=A0A9W9IMP3_9EURO|nr:hypothetical protein N7492_004173 [Penicillium capsulatum]